MTSTRYVIMANGSGTRWGEYLGTPKHLLRINGETLLRRITRQLLELDATAEIIISSSDSRYDTEGASRHRPAANEIELDRFVPELLSDNICFLYGDTYYEDSAMSKIVETRAEEPMFFGDERSIVAIKSEDSAVLLTHIERVRQLYLSRKIEQCIGWQVYHSYAGLPLEGKAIGRNFLSLGGNTFGFNSPQDYNDFLVALERSP